MSVPTSAILSNSHLHFRLLIFRQFIKCAATWDSSYATWCRINELGGEYLDPEGVVQVPVTEAGLLYFTLECGADGVPSCEDYDTAVVFLPGRSSGT